MRWKLETNPRLLNYRLNLFHGKKGWSYTLYFWNHSEASKTKASDFLHQLPKPNIL